ncbi:MAG TPA: ABC transporter permease, partial [Acidobacteriaceae bacterium]|nr:ABC transporter permease [Acidobacteriaceae bacterium]
MEWLREFFRRIGMLRHRDQVASELQEEMQLHLDLRCQQQVESGVAPNDAAAAAQRRFGNATLLRERSYTAWGWSWLEGFLQDVIYGLRAMLRSPGVTIVALLSLALGIGANTAIFSLMDAVMLRSLPVKDPGKLLLLGTGEVLGGTNSFGNTFLYSYPFYRQMQQRNQVFSDVAAFLSLHNDVHGLVEGRKEIEPMQVQLVSGTYFSTLGVQAMRGRMLTGEDDRIEGGNPVAVVSNAWWKRSLASDPAVLSKRLEIGSTSFSIVGVAPPEFFGTMVGESPDIWIPLSMMREVPPHYGSYTDNSADWLEIFGRLKPGVSVAQATTNVNLLFQQILLGYAGGSPSQKDLAMLKQAHVELTPMARGLSSLRAEFSSPLKIMMAIVGLVLLIACANIANLLLARSTARAHEFAVRQALGAQRGRLVRQLLTESLMLAVTGGALGVVLAAGASRLLLRMVSTGAEVVPLNLSIDTRMLLFTLVITLATALLFGTIPAFRATRLELTATLKDGRGTTRSRTRSPLARVLVISQVALSLVLVVGAGLFLRSLVNLIRVDTGFNKENVLRLQTDASSAGYKSDDPRLQSLYRQIEARVAALPGVRAASFSTSTFHEGTWGTSVFTAGDHMEQIKEVEHNIVGNGYFATMQIPVLAGRTFGSQDTPASQKVAVISEGMARTLFPQGSPIGRRFGMEDPKNANDFEVIGVAKDVKFHDLQESDNILDYLAAVQQAIHDVDHNLPISNVTTLDEQVARSYTDERLVAQLSIFFGLLAVFLSAIGIYGLMSYVVSRRTNEIGIRMALGADRMHVRWLVLREVLILVAIGVAIGTPAALLSSRLVTSMLFGLHGH